MAMPPKSIHFVKDLPLEVIVSRGDGWIDRIGTGPLCKPSTLPVQICSPERGWKSVLSLGQSFSNENEPVWSITIELSERSGEEYVIRFSIRYTADDPSESKAIKFFHDNATPLVSLNEFNKFYPQTRLIADDRREPTPQEVDEIKERFRQILSSAPIDGDR